MKEAVCWAAGFISLPCRLKHAPMSFLSNQEEKEMFSLPGPWVRVSRELIDQASVSHAPGRAGPACSAHRSTTRAFSPDDSGF